MNAAHSKPALRRPRQEVCCRAWKAASSRHPGKHTGRRAEPGTSELQTELSVTLLWTAPSLAHTLGSRHTHAPPHCTTPGLQCACSTRPYRLHVLSTRLPVPEDSVEVSLHCFLKHLPWPLPQEQHLPKAVPGSPTTTPHPAFSGSPLPWIPPLNARDLARPTFLSALVETPARELGTWRVLPLCRLASLPATGISWTVESLTPATLAPHSVSITWMSGD